MKNSKVFISGHRGTRVHAIENTRAAFEYCLQNSFDYVEFDVKRTKDNQLVVFHDRIINNLLNGTGLVEEFSLKELKRLRYADNQQILTLEEFFSLVGKRIRPMLEIKSRNISNLVIESVHKFGYLGGEIMIQSFNRHDLAECYRLDPQYDYGLCVGSFLKFPLFRRMLARMYYRVVFKPYPFISWVNANGIDYYDAIVQLLSKHGIQIILGAKDTHKYLSNLASWGVKIVNCDDGTAIKKQLG